MLAVGLIAGNAFAQSKQQYKVGVLPFLDNTGSGGAGTADAVASAVQTDFAHSTQIEGRVISTNGEDPSSIDGAKAVQLGQAQNVDAVLLGTVIEASSEQSGKGLGGVSFGGFSLGNSKHTVKATVTLQGDLYDVKTGRQIDSIRITRHVSNSAGGDVSTSISEISTGKTFDSSPLGQAFHQAAEALVLRIAGDQSKMTHFAAENTAGSGGATPASAASPSSSGAGGKQPNLVTTKIDFVPGEKTVFQDDFSDMPPGEPPPHWQVRNGTVSLAMGGGIRELRVSKDVVLTSPTLKFPDNFTFQVKYVDPDDGETTYEFEDKDNDDSLRLDVSAATSRTIDIGYGVNDQLGSSPIQLGACKTPCEVDMWVQQGRLRLYYKGNRIVDVNQVKYKPITHLVISQSWTTLGLRSVRIAESAPDPGLVLATTGKYVTHGIHFDTDSDILKPESAGVIKEISDALYKHPDMKLEIDGFTDSTGGAAHNLDLSRRRAEAVMNVLVSQFGIDKSRLTAKGFGDANPIASNDTAEGRAQNRRVEFIKQAANGGGSSEGGVTLQRLEKRQ